MLPKLTGNDLIAFSEHAEKVKLFDWLMIDPFRNALYYRFIYLFCQKMRPAVMVELGTAEGVSSMCMAMGNPDGKVVTIDQTIRILRNDCKRPNVKYILGNSIALMQCPVENIDLLFVDTDHDGRALQEFEHWRPRMAKNGVVLFDDVFLNDAMKRFWKEFKPKEAEKVVLPLHGIYGFGAVILNADT